MPRLAKLFTTLFLLLPVQLLAEEKATAIVLVADTRKFHGWEALWANLFNEGHLSVALITIIIIPLSGAILGTIADFGMSHLGIDLKKRSLSEH